MKIIKRSGAEAIFDANKIAQAVKKANDSVVEAERLSYHQIAHIVEKVVPCSESFLKRGRNTGSCGECHYA